MLKKIQSEPTIAAALVSLATVVLGFFIHNPELIAAMIGVIAALLGIRQVVTPVTVAATQITQAATDTATKVVQDLDQTTAGAVGEVTTAGVSVINNAVNTVVGGIIGKG